MILTQKQRVLKQLRYWTSPLDALEKCGTMRLSAHIYQLKAEGHVIEDYIPNGKHYKVYRLKK